MQSTLHISRLAPVLSTFLTNESQRLSYRVRAFEAHLTSTVDCLITCSCKDLGLPKAFAVGLKGRNAASDTGFADNNKWNGMRSESG